MKTFRSVRVDRAVERNPLFRLWERELSAVQGILLFGFRIDNVGELATLALGAAALVFLIGAVGVVFGGVSLLAAVFLLGGLAILFYTSWRQPINEYKHRFLRDEELPAALEMVLGGLEAGVSVENTFLHIARNLKGVVGRLFVGVQEDIDAGKSISDALTVAAEKSLNVYFERFVAVVVAGREMGGGDTQYYLKQLLEEIEDVRSNERIESAGSINNTLFFPIFIGYFLPILVLFSLPFIFSLSGMFQIF